jgi:hypothetical protein
MKNNVILIKTHILNKQFQRLYDELSKICDVFVLFDKPIDRDNFIFTDFDKLNDYICNRNDKYWYYNHYSLMYFYNFINSNYTYYWFIEHDVRYSGEWLDFLNKCEGLDDDLLCGRLIKPNNNWCWFNDRNFNDCEIYSMVGSIYRISNRGVNLIHNQQTIGVNGFNELLIPSLLKKHGLKISDFNDYFDAYYDNTYDWNLRGFDGEIKNKLWHKIVDGD